MVGVVVVVAVVVVVGVVVTVDVAVVVKDDVALVDGVVVVVGVVVVGVVVRLVVGVVVGVVMVQVSNPPPTQASSMSSMRWLMVRHFSMWPCDPVPWTMRTPAAKQLMCSGYNTGSAAGPPNSVRATARCSATRRHFTSPFGVPDGIPNNPLMSTPEISSFKHPRFISEGSGNGNFGSSGVKMAVHL